MLWNPFSRRHENPNVSSNRPILRSDPTKAIVSNALCSSDYIIYFGTYIVWFNSEVKVVNIYAYLGARKQNLLCTDRKVYTTSNANRLLFNTLLEQFSQQKDAIFWRRSVVSMFTVRETQNTNISLFHWDSHYKFCVQRLTQIIYEQVK